jgi:hypothetical protein
VSTVTSLYIFTTAQIKELRQLAAQIPKPKKPPKGSYKVPVTTRPKDYDAGIAPYQPFWDYILDKGDYKSREFHWHGIIMERALIYLREKGIDLTKTPFIEGDEKLAYLYFDKKFKDKYLKRLDPKLLDQDDLIKWLDEYHWGTAAEGIIDSVQHLQYCFQFIDEDHVLLLHTDYMDDVINSVPMNEMTQGMIKQKSIQYLCDACGKRLTKNWEAVKRISDVPTDKKHRCGDSYHISTFLVNGREVEETFDSTFLMKKTCKAHATGCYRTPM